MSFTPQDVINAVRFAVQDTKVSYRYADGDLLQLTNQVLRRIALLRPDLFAYVSTINCVAGTIQQAPADSIRIIDVLLSGAGLNVNEVNRETLDLMFQWQSMTPDVAKDWMRHVRSPNTFFVYPPSPVGQVLTIEYAKAPGIYGLNDTVELLGDAYFPCVVDGVIWLAESIDNEHVNSGRAKMFLDSFNQLLGMTAQIKHVTDTEESNLNPKQVV